MNHQKMKTAVITGGGSGIGLAIAEKFVKEQIRCILIGRDKDKLQKASDLLGPLAFGVSFDLTGLSGLPGLVSSIEKEYGKIDILVNNAGIHLKKPLMEVSDEEFQKVVMTNQNAVFSMSREVAKVMSTRKSGNIINISSMASQYGLPYVIAYTAAKSAVEGMTRAMAVELSPIGIRVNCVAPGFIQTEMSSGALKNDPERQRKVFSRTPMGRLGTPAEVADAVYFLASESSSFITGVILPVDGGNSIGF
ncbi:MAG: SDR family NAD(P)-dependent oxidoreductase [Bacteroidales bacterium]|nr:SDR family NAD(P)-dependent oxidoreductase [Bacteroidales bacterium]